MKTSEAYQLAEQNPNAKFNRINLNNAVYRFNKYGVLEFQKGEKWVTTESVPTLNEEWSLVQEQVTWQEAFDGWLNSEKNFRVEYGGKVYHQRNILRLGCLRTDSGEVKGFESAMFEDGRWYFEE